MTIYLLESAIIVVQVMLYKKVHRLCEHLSYEMVAETDPQVTQRCITTQVVLMTQEKCRQKLKRTIHTVTILHLHTAMKKAPTDRMLLRWFHLTELVLRILLLRVITSVRLTVTTPLPPQLTLTTKTLLQRV